MTVQLSIILMIWIFFVTTVLAGLAFLYWWNGAVKAEEEAAAKRREADKQHNANINNAAAKSMVDALMAYDSGEKPLTIEQAKLVVTAIAKGHIPHVTISY